MDTKKAGLEEDLPKESEETITTCPQMIQSVSCDHGDDERPGRGDRWGWTSSHGIRACSRACALRVGMFFSYLLYFIFPKRECKFKPFTEIYKIFITNFPLK